jgi:hypothetical protein
VQAHGPDILVLDGLAAAEKATESPRALPKFVQDGPQPSLRRRPRSRIPGEGRDSKFLRT